MEITPEQPVVTVYPWNLSKTGYWGPKTGLHELRDLDPDELAEWLCEPGHVQNSAIAEIVAHGNPKKAAKLARALVHNHPVSEKSIREGFGEFANILLTFPLSSLPSEPKEYPAHVKIEYIQ